MEIDKDKNPTALIDLRRQAENLLKAKMSEIGIPQINDDTLRFLHELQVHQIELELQNTELRQARNELESALEKYTDLYDFSPVAYFTLDHNETVRAANLTSAGLLGIERSRLINSHFGLFVVVEYRQFFSQFLEKVFHKSLHFRSGMAL